MVSKESDAFIDSEEFLRETTNFCQGTEIRCRKSSASVVTNQDDKVGFNYQKPKKYGNQREVTKNPLNNFYCSENLYQKLVREVENIQNFNVNYGKEELSEILSVSWQYVQRCSAEMKRSRELSKTRIFLIDEKDTQSENMNIEGFLCKIFSPRCKQIPRTRVLKRTFAKGCSGKSVKPPPPPAKQPQGTILPLSRDFSLHRLFPCNGFHVARPPPSFCSEKPSRRPHTTDIVFVLVLSFLDARSLSIVTQLCYGCYDFCNSDRYRDKFDRIWRNLCYKQFGFTSKLSKVKPKVKYRQMVQNSKSRNILIYGETMNKGEVVNAIYACAQKHAISVLEVKNKVRNKTFFSSTYGKSIWCAARVCNPCIILLCEAPQVWIQKDEKRENKGIKGITNANLIHRVSNWDKSRSKKGTTMLSPISSMVMHRNLPAFNPAKSTVAQKQNTVKTEDFMDIKTAVITDVFSDLDENQVCMITIENRKMTIQADEIFQTRFRAYSRAPACELNPKINILTALKEKLSSIDHSLTDGDMERVINHSFFTLGDANSIIQASANSFLKRLRSSQFFRINKETNKYEICTPSCKDATKIKLSDIPFSRLRYGPITLDDFLTSIKTRNKIQSSQCKNPFGVEKLGYTSTCDTQRTNFRTIPSVDQL